MGENMLFPRSSPLAGRSSALAPAFAVLRGGSVGFSASLRCCIFCNANWRCRFASDPGVKLSGAGGAFLRLSQSALARMLRTALLLGEGDVLNPVEDDRELDDVEANGMVDLAGVVRVAGACNDSGVSSGEK